MSPYGPPYQKPPGANPFGQPAPLYGAPAVNPFETLSYPAPASPFGARQPFAADAFPPAPLGYATPLLVSPAAPSRPTAVLAAFFALLLAAVLTLGLAGLGVYAMSEARDSVDTLMHLDRTGTVSLVSSDYLDDTQMTLAAVLVGVAALFTVGYLLVARGVWRGKNWPRQLSPFLTALSLPFAFFGFTAILTVLAGAVAAVALWLPPARKFADQTPLGRVR